MGEGRSTVHEGGADPKLNLQIYSMELRAEPHLKRDLLLLRCVLHVLVEGCWWSP
jgi:hypothetical protein